MSRAKGADTPARDAPRIFSGVGKTYEFVATVLSLGQDPRWRGALVDAVRAKPGERILDIATGTGMVARELRARYGCAVVGLDQSADMLQVAASDGRGVPLVRGLAERLPFPDASFDHVTFTYLLRYVDDPAATVREVTRVLKPGGRLAALEFSVPRGPLWYPLWKLYTRVGLPLAGRLVSRRWGEVCAFLGPNIEDFYRRHPQRSIEGYWRAADIDGLTARSMSLGGGVVMSGTKGAPRPQTGLGLAPAFYALAPGGWRDLWGLLHPPYLVWHLSYVLFGAALAPAPEPRVVLGALAAFTLAVGVGAHAFDEVAGRPLGTRLPDWLLVALGTIGLGGAVALGLVAAASLGGGFTLVVVAGAALVALYAFNVPLVHSDVGFALAWGSFPVVATAIACGAPLGPALVVALGAALLSQAQRRLSTRARRIRRAAHSVSGAVVYRDGAREIITAASLIDAPEAALRVLWLASAALALGVLLARWS